MRWRCQGANRVQPADAQTRLAERLLLHCLHAPFSQQPFEKGADPVSCAQYVANGTSFNLGIGIEPDLPEVSCRSRGIRLRRSGGSGEAIDSWPPTKPRSTPQNNGYCDRATCSSKNCTSAFQREPVIPANVTDPAPRPPLFGEPLLVRSRFDGPRRLTLTPATRVPQQRTGMENNVWQQTERCP
jgi:hypothetical protein